LVEVLPDDRQLGQPVCDGTGKLRQRDQRIVDENRRRVDLAGGQQRHGAGVQRGTGEVVAVDPLTGDSDEQATGADLAGVELDGAGDFDVRTACEPSAGDLCDLGQAERDHP
jgi:hypothetical protein